MDDDADLAARVRRGDRQAFDDLYDLYADDVFSMCLLILGDPTVARAAAGTAFALVARTRLNPLSDPARLRSWLLELARGSALAWSGSPQARSIPVPHGVPPEELLVGSVVPAPASLRVGLARTFDRAAAVAEAAAASRRGAQPAAPAAPRGISLVKAPAWPGATPASDAAETLIAPATVRALPLMRMDAEVEPANIDPAPGRGTLDWRSRPTMAAAAAVVVAVVGLTAAMNWPSSDTHLMSENGTAVVSPPRSLDMIRPAPAPAAPSGRTAASPTVVPTVAGAFTSRASAPREVRPRLVEPIARDVHRSEPTAAPSTNRPHSTSGAPSTSAPRTTPPKLPAGTAASTTAPTSPTSGTPGTPKTPGTPGSTTPPKAQAPQPTGTVSSPESAPPTSATTPPAAPQGGNAPSAPAAPSSPQQQSARPPAGQGTRSSTEGTGSTGTPGGPVGTGSTEGTEGSSPTGAVPSESDDRIVGPVTGPAPVSV
jgi:DNA-directed RNA polymerase specialized sigma24 family protein